MIEDTQIVVVHYDDEILKLLKKFLKLKNLRVQTFQNSNEGLEHIKSNSMKINIIIWDIWMPGKKWHNY